MLNIVYYVRQSIALKMIILIIYLFYLSYLFTKIKILIKKIVTYTLLDKPLYVSKKEKKNTLVSLEFELRFLIILISFFKRRYF